MFTMLYICLKLLLLLYCIFQICLCKGRPLNITVLHTNDLHGRYQEVNENYSLCNKEEQKKDECYGGIARIATVVKRIRASEDNVVFLDGGDRFTGTLWTDVYRGNATQTFINELNYTAVTLGNHDFDYRIPYLVNFIQGTKPPVVVSNINTSLEPLWPSGKQLIKKSVVVDIGGEKVGIVGYTIIATRSTSNFGGNVQFLPIINSVQKAVMDLESKGITKIIAIGHAGFDVDKEIAKKVKGVDIVVGGHTNTFLYTGTPPSIEKPEGPYPYIVRPECNASLSIPCVQAFAYSKYLGHLQVTFDDKGHVTSWHGNPILLDNKIKKDPSVDSVVKRLQVLVDKKGETKIGTSKVILDAANKICQKQPCVLGEVTTAAMLYHFRSYNASIALISGNSIAASLHTDKEGNVFSKDIATSFPYGNTIDLIELSGEDITRSLEVSAYLQVAGLRVQYSFDNSVRHVELLEVQRSRCSSNNCYHPINKTKIYKVVVNSYIATINGNKVIGKKARNRIRGDSIYKVIEEYFKDFSPVTAKHGISVNRGLKLEQSRNILFVIIIALSFITIC